MIKRCFFLSLLLAIWLNTVARGETTPFTATVNGVTMTFLALNETEAQLGLGMERAIAKDYEGSLTIPATVMNGKKTYSVTRIGQLAFNSCAGLSAVELPATIQYVNSNAFYHCTGLKRVVVRDLSAWCRVTFANIFANPLFYARHLYGSDGIEVTDLVVPDDVTAIGSYAFAQCGFKTVTIPGSVKQVGSYAFYGCTSLLSVVMAPGVEGVNSYAFSGCASLSSVTLPEGLYRLGGFAFYNSQSLSEIVLPSSIGVIASGCFKQCKGLQRVISHIYKPFPLEPEVFLSVSPVCSLSVPPGTLTGYISYGWTRDVFGGSMTEEGDVETNFCVENPVVKSFLDEVEYPSDDYSFTRITDYIHRQTDYWKDQPQAVRIEAPLTTEGETMVLQTLKDGQLVRSDTFYVGQKGLDIWNLTPKTRYDYKLLLPTDDGGLKLLAQGTFTTQGRLRMLRIDNMRNVRDIGGWALPGGRRVSYDKVFRSAELAKSSNLISAKGIKELIDFVGIDVELDFADTIYSNYSPVAGLLEHVHGPEYQMSAYVGAIGSKYQETKNCFDRVLQCLREGKKVLMHCSDGADRAGTLAFLIESLLGVSESDLAKEYELTCFYLEGEGEYRRHRTAYYRDMVEYVKGKFPAPTLNESVEQLMLSFGVPQSDIDDLRLLMTEQSEEAMPHEPETDGTADVNGDGVVDLNDVKLLMEYIATHNNGK